MNQKRNLLLLTLVLLILFVIAINYFLSALTKMESEVKNSKELDIQEQIMQAVTHLDKKYKIMHLTPNTILDAFIFNLKNPTNIKNVYKEVWLEANSWVSKTQLYELESRHLGNVINALKSSKIIKADIDTRGTQLKLLLTLEVSILNI